MARDCRSGVRVGGRSRLHGTFLWVGGVSLLAAVPLLAQASLAPVVLAQSAIDNLGGPSPVAETAPVEAAPVEAAPIIPETEVAPPPVENPLLAPAPNAAEVPAAPQSGSNDAYIDATGYGIGATYRTQPAEIAGESGLSGGGRLGSLPSLSAVQVGPINVSSTGLGLGTLPSVRDFYRRTLRPPAQLGNGNIQLIFPLSIPAPITSLFGWRQHPLFGDARFHTGVDLGAPMGTPVVAAYAGQVALADFLGGYGLAVALNHNKDTQQTLYAHLSEIFVQPGEWVKQGAVIGRVGSTGNSTGPHLHFEFRQLTPEGWVALDAGAQLEFSLAQLVKMMDVSANGIASAQGVLVSRQDLVGASGAIAWQPPTKAEAKPLQPAAPAARTNPPTNENTLSINAEAPE
jgi:murein DD-endopeptidase MepM/ murein hydrolase activator NlpD